ncbi:MAG: hypothetical protein ACP5HH_07320 [Fervidicoccaceae archaeon]
MRIVLTDNLTADFFPYYISELNIRMKKVTWGDLIHEINYHYRVIQDIPETLAIYVRNPNIRQFLSFKINSSFVVYNEDYVYEPNDHIFIILPTKEPIDENNLVIYKMSEPETDSLGFEARDLEKLANMMKELSKACEENNHNEKVKIVETIMDKFELKVYDQFKDDEPAIILDDTCIPYLYIPKILKKGE